MYSILQQRRILRGLLLIIPFVCIGAYSDMGKNSSPQNLFTNGRSQFITKNNSRVVVQKGGLAILPCVVKLNSAATVSWIRRKDFQLLTVGLSTHSSDKRFLVEHTRHMGHWSLRIKSVREDDRGLYECQLSVYPTQSIFIELKVVEAEADITGSPDIHIDEGSTLRLECKLKKATEIPEFVFWYHDDKMVNYDTQNGFFVKSNLHKDPIVSDNHLVKSEDATLFKSNNKSGHSYKIGQSFGFTLPASISILTILKVRFHHAGNYTCAPSNARSASTSVHVLQDEKPAAMQHFNRTIWDGELNNNSLSTTGTTTSNNSSNTILSIFYLKIILLCTYATNIGNALFTISRSPRLRTINR
ncbi:defective proboscis extension response 19 [Musca autumnalis]|uniref:defective proboscis extension response 19 n=1 Tax=Musca autumnalis TaxID=221902 RepID=UPI003CEC44CF